MVDERKLAKAGDTLKGQGQQDAPRTPADLAVSEGNAGGGTERRPGAPAEAGPAGTPKPPN